MLIPNTVAVRWSADPILGSIAPVTGTGFTGVCGVTAAHRCGVGETIAGARPYARTRNVEKTIGTVEAVRVGSDSLQTVRGPRRWPVSRRSYHPPDDRWPEHSSLFLLEG